MMPICCSKKIIHLTLLTIFFSLPSAYAGKFCKCEGACHCLNLPSPLQHQQTDNCSSVLEEEPQRVTGSWASCENSMQESFLQESGLAINNLLQNLIEINSDHFLKYVDQWSELSNLIDKVNLLNAAISSYEQAHPSPPPNIKEHLVRVSSTLLDYPVRLTYGHHVNLLNQLLEDSQTSPITHIDMSDTSYAMPTNTNIFIDEVDSQMESWERVNIGTIRSIPDTDITDTDITEPSNLEGCKTSYHHIYDEIESALAGNQNVFFMLYISNFTHIPGYITRQDDGQLQLQIQSSQRSIPINREIFTQWVLKVLKELNNPSSSWVKMFFFRYNEGK